MHRSFPTLRIVCTRWDSSTMASARSIATKMDSMSNNKKRTVSKAIFTFQAKMLWIWWLWAEETTWFSYAICFFISSMANWYSFTMIPLWLRRKSSRGSKNRRIVLHRSNCAARMKRVKYFCHLCGKYLLFISRKNLTTKSSNLYWLRPFWTAT